MSDTTRTELTDAEWREFQQIPEQGYSHRAWIDHKIAAALAKSESELAEARAAKEPTITVGNLDGSSVYEMPVSEYAQTLADRERTRAMKAEQQLSEQATTIELVTDSAREGLADCDDDCDMSAVWVLETLSRTDATDAVRAIKAEAVKGELREFRKRVEQAFEWPNPELAMDVLAKIEFLMISERFPVDCAVTLSTETKEETS